MTTAVTINSLRPAATTETDLYTVPAGKQARCKLFSANSSSTSDVIRIALADNGAATAQAQRIRDDMSLAKNTPDEVNFLLEATDVVRVYSTNGTTNFNLVAFEDDIQV